MKILPNAQQAPVTPGYDEPLPIISSPMMPDQLTAAITDLACFIADSPPSSPTSAYPSATGQLATATTGHGLSATDFPLPDAWLWDDDVFVPRRAEAALTFRDKVSKGQ